MGRSKMKSTTGLEPPTQVPDSTGPRLGSQPWRAHKRGDGMWHPLTSPERSGTLRELRVVTGKAWVQMSTGSHILLSQTGVPRSPKG